MKTLIIEDEGAARRRLESIVNNHPALKLEGSAESGAKAVELINSTNADLLLMDIQLKDMTAFEVLNRIKKDYSGSIIFVTAFNDFAIKAFEVFAIDYVLKPYSEERVISAIKRRLNSIETPNKEVYAILESLHFPDKICIPEGKTSHLFMDQEIEWVEADGYHCRIHTSDGEQRLIRILLKHIHKLLPDHYLRISRSIIINSTLISTYKDNANDTLIRLKNGKAFHGTMNYLR